MSRVTTRARHGLFSYYIQPNAAFDGLSLALASLTNTGHYVSLYQYTTSTGTPQVSLDGRNWFNTTAIGGRTDGMVRYGVAVAAALASGSTRLHVRFTVGADYWVDDVQVEPKDYATTYIDGDRPGCRWTGLRHGSISRRSAQESTGGRERDLYDDYGISVVEGTKRVGMPPVMHHLLGHTQLPGAMYQGSKVLPREIELRLHYSADDWAAFHAKRAAVIELFKPDRVRDDQPIIIGYAGSGDTLYSAYYYNGGMEFGDFLSYDEAPTIRLLAPDPFWYADDQETVSLALSQTLTNTLSLARVDGDWQTLGTGFTSIPAAIVPDPSTGRVYFGGNFARANGVTVNGICYWDGATFRTMGAGADDSVNCIAIAPNGDVWIGGNFNAVDGAASYAIARWNLASSTWTRFTVGTTSDEVYSIAFDSNGLMYVGGFFTNWNGNANSDYIVTYDGTSWAPLGTGANAYIFKIIPESPTRVYMSGSFTTFNSVSATRIGYWNGSTFVALGTGADAPVTIMTRAPNGDLYVGGSSITTIGGVSASIARWNGSTYVALGDGLTGGWPWEVAVLPSGDAWVSGSFETAGGLDLPRLAGWNGSTWYPVSVSLPGAAEAMAMVDDDVYLAINSGGDPTAAELTTVTPAATVTVRPVFTLLGPTTPGTSCTLRWLENQSTEQRMYFNLNCFAGETITIDPLAGLVVSSRRGRITDQPLSNSDFTNFKLLPTRADGAAANILAAFATGTLTGAELLLHYQPAHWSADGPA